MIKLNLLLLIGQVIRLTIDFNINDLCDNFNNILYDPKPPRVCKSSPEAGNWVQFRFSSTGDIIFQQVMYPRQYRRNITCIFVLNIKNPVIRLFRGYYTYRSLKFTAKIVMNIDWILLLILWISRCRYYILEKLITNILNGEGYSKLNLFIKESVKAVLADNKELISAASYSSMYGL